MDGCSTVVPKRGLGMGLDIIRAGLIIDSTQYFIHICERTIMRNKLWFVLSRHRAGSDGELLSYTSSTLAPCHDAPPCASRQPPSGSSPPTQTLIGTPTHPPRITFRTQWQDFDYQPEHWQQVHQTIFHNGWSNATHNMAGSFSIYNFQRFHLEI